jgi:hypothetical protein
MKPRPGLKLSHGFQKMRDAPRYSEAFKLRPVEDVAGGKYASLDEAGHGTVEARHWAS